MIKRLFFVAGVLLMLSGLASAQAFSVISASEVKSHIDRKSKMVLADAREENEYRAGHIPTAVNIPPDQVASLEKRLPRNRRQLIIFYCRGTGWGLSKQAAVAAAKAGYENIRLFSGGMPEWQAAGYPVVR